MFRAMELSSGHTTEVTEAPRLSSAHERPRQFTPDDAVERVKNKAEKFDDMSYMRVGLILFR